MDHAAQREVYTEDWSSEKADAVQEPAVGGMLLLTHVSCRYRDKIQRHLLLRKCIESGFFVDLYSELGLRKKCCND